MIDVCEDVVAGIEEGSSCPQPGCSGVMDLSPSRNCSCHISAPCSSCTGAGYECGKCGWESSPDNYEPEPQEPPKRYAAGSRRNEWTSTHTSGPFNSTPFTTCCSVAAIEKERCPNCEAEIHFHDDGLAQRRREVGPGNCLMCGKKRGDPSISGNCHC